MQLNEIIGNLMPFYLRHPYGIMEWWPALARRELNRKSTWPLLHVWLFHKRSSANQVWAREYWNGGGKRGKKPFNCGQLPIIPSNPSFHYSITRNILALSNSRAKTLDGLSGVLWRCQKPCLLHIVSSRGLPCLDACAHRPSK